jgi:hypothetical protein
LTDLAGCLASPCSVGSKEEGSDTQRPLTQQRPVHLTLPHIDTAFKQQRLPAWQPILTPKWVIFSFTLIGACWLPGFSTVPTHSPPLTTKHTPPHTPPGLVFLPLGIVLKLQSDAIVEYSLQYDGAGTPAAQAACQITPTTAEPAPPCTVTFNVDRTMKAPVYVYYQLDNFYQNHRRYVKSRSDAQLMGEVLPESGLADCDPLKTITDNGETKVLNPCGLIANRWVGVCGGGAVV